MAEAKFEKEVIAWVEEQGGMAQRVEARGVRGWPDLDVRLPNGKAALIELKRPKGSHKVSPHQVETIQKLRALGQVAFVSRDLEEIIERLTRLSTESD